MERSLLPFSNGKVMCSFHLASCSTEKSQETREEERCLNFLIARLLAAVGNVVLSVVPSGPDRPDQVQLFPRCIESGPLVVELCLATRVVFRSLSSVFIAFRPSAVAVRYSLNPRVHRVLREHVHNQAGRRAAGTLKSSKFFAIIAFAKGERTVGNTLVAVQSSPCTPSSSFVEP